MTPNSAVDFLTSYEAVRYSTEQRYSGTYVVALPTDPDNNQNYIHEISQQKSVEGKANNFICTITRTCDLYCKRPPWLAIAFVTNILSGQLEIIENLILT